MIYKEEYLVKNIKLNKINKTIKNHILEHKKNIIRFKFDRRIDSVIDKSNKYNKVNLYIIFYSEKKDVTHTYYFKCPKPMIENQMLKILDANPLLIKSLGAYLEVNLLINYIIFKYWGRIDVFNKKKVLVHDHIWYEFRPQHPSQELLEFMRSC